MNEQWQELKETIIEMRDNDGTGTQQETCKFLANLMDVLEEQMQKPKIGHWIDLGDGEYRCPKCHKSFINGMDIERMTRFFPRCPNCGAKMESEE